MINQNFFNTIFVIPILNVLVALYKLFTIIKIPGAFGFAIIGLTVIVRAAFQPFFKNQLEMSSKMNEIKPELDALTKKYKNDPKQLQAEQLKLYQKAGINPASGCLSMIIQMPIFIGLYQTLSLFLVNGQGEKLITSINKVLYTKVLTIGSINPWFFGINLAISPQSSKSVFYLLIPLITGLLQYLQAKLTVVNTSANKAIIKDGDKKENQSGTEDFQKAMNTQMQFLFPIMIGWFAYTLPVGLSVYWNIFSLFSIVQSYQLKKLKVDSSKKDQK